MSWIRILTYYKEIIVNIQHFKSFDSYIFFYSLENSSYIMLLNNIACQKQTDIRFIPLVNITGTPSSRR